MFLSMITHSYYQNVLKQIEVAGMEESRSYKYHYVLIVDDCEMQFWKDVYESMKAEAEKQDALVELMGRSLSSDMEIENFMDMSIAAKVDGIVLEYTGGHRLSDRIEEASRAGIPVVTVLKDAPATSRESYVGINSYQLGQQYGELVMELARKNRDGAEVMVLTHDSGNDGSQSQILEQINNFVVTSPDVGGRIHVTRENIQSTGKVDADEALRNIFFRQEGGAGHPDLYGLGGHGGRLPGHDRLQQGGGDSAGGVLSVAHHIKRCGEGQYPRDPGAEHGADGAGLRPGADGLPQGGPRQLLLQRGFQLCDQ